MAVLTYEQIEQVARAGGLPGDPGVWAAIAMAESSGRTDVVNSIGCVGLWQINQPVHVKAHPSWTVQWLSNPVNNAKAASVIFRAQGREAWEAYTGPDGKGSDGPWRQYYKGKAAGATQASWDPLKDFWDDLLGEPKRGPDSPNWDDDPFGLGEAGGGLDLGLGDVATGIGTIAEGVQKTAAWLGSSRNWVRIGYVAGGAVLALVGLQIIARPLINAAPTAKVAKAAKSVAKTTKKPAAGKATAKTSTGSADG